MQGSFAGLLVATLGGAAIGLERRSSGHATGPQARFGGVRTFTMLGGVSGIAGWAATRDYLLPAVVLLAAAGGLIVAGYAAASRRDVDGTTEPGRRVRRRRAAGRRSCAGTTQRRRRTP